MTRKIDQATLINHLKTTGFFIPSSQIYGGFANAFDLGPIGALLKQRLKDLWIDFFIHQQENFYLIDTNIILNPKVWKASMHLDKFNDPLVDCKNCKNRFRVDKLIEAKDASIEINENWTTTEFEQLMDKMHLTCPECNKFDWTKIRNFNLMFETKIGTIEEDKNIAYLRPETAQGIFINFKNITRLTRSKLPLAICHIGKSFRNEITPGNFVYRTKEFEQMEIEYFCEPNSADSSFSYLLDLIWTFLTKQVGIKSTSLKKVEYEKDQLAHYSNRTVDIFFDFLHGSGELMGIANRTDFDLKKHQEASLENLEYFDQVNNKKFLPYIIEPSFGVERLMYAILTDAYYEQVISETDTRTVLKLSPNISPYIFAIYPLTKTQNDLAKKIYIDLKKQYKFVYYDAAGSIGKRYRRADSIGINYCITIDFDTEKDNTLTIRDRDSMQQIKLKLNELNLNTIQQAFSNLKDESKQTSNQ